MKTLLKSVNPIIVAMFGVAAIGSMNANAAVSYTCMATVYTGPQSSGFAPLGSMTVTGATITEAASACHKFARDKFTANSDWSDANKVCSRYPSGTPRHVEVLDYFNELGHAGGYNRVGGFTVTCNAAHNVQPYSTAPTVVPTH